MAGNDDHISELERFFLLEYGDPYEVALRFVGIIGGGVLLYLYTGWLWAFVWPAGFTVAQLSYFAFLRFRAKPGTARDVTISSVLFLVVLISFIWMPVEMVTNDDRAMSISGAALIGCILVFLVRRSDTVPFLLIGEVVVVGLMIGLVYLRLIPQFSDVKARLGLLLSGAALLFYFAQGLRISRKIRLSAALATERSLQAQKMAAVGNLAGGVAHDFNNNLTAIMGHLELLALLDDPEERRASLADAMLASQQAAKTVRQLLIYARKERMYLTPQTASEVIEGLLALTRRLIPASVSIQSALPAGDPVFLADRGQLLAGLINLVVNAVDAMPTGGQVTLMASTARVAPPFALADGSMLSGGDYAVLAVRDTGAGIPAAIRNRVLEPFFTTKPVGKGTGLGLPMVAGMAREFGGGLVIASLSSGTTVSIYLPIYHGPPEVMRPSQP